MPCAEYRLWLTGISTPICFSGAYIFQNSSPVFEILISVGTFPIISACLGFIFFAIFKPEKLQSEDYQIRHESLQIIQQKSGSIELPSVSLENIANPAARTLTDSGVEK
ncbi:hypothetical protein H4J51_01650 [Colwellia sp. MB02u-18]|uniref:hypothetical protein n=1 Tax=unclassified Colwellia TaxID=196834 RepID=UPI0015F36900|nr:MULTISPECIES: hypothetical protein [unclassified Colwellia]MBA6222826.1 hypothetical protein [Colwellia sp. MB3u-45]MBA6266583.1 hypothetical protein [Colwellia sp. MB3u-43]MBA6320407.1 hypothetical protein [Colwellia sp. MB02u-19]MBA6323283.1 hypothetical protein [Colwellia sp. MB02u-18]MBA6329792.1 hypothetical protein [Colwellia sp. MB02u-12]